MLKKVLFLIKTPSAFFIYKMIFSTSKVIFLLIGLGFNLPCLAKTNLDGTFLLRLRTPQIQNQSIKSFSTYSQLYLTGSFQPNNDLKSQIHLLFPQYYGQSNLDNFLIIYPSVHWFILDNIELKLGRNLYEKKDTVSLNSYEDYWYSLDGLFLKYSTKVVSFDIWTAYLPKRWVANEQVKEFNYGFGFFLDIELTENYIDSFNFHVAYLGDSFVDKNANKMSRYGLSLMGNINPIGLVYNFSAIGHTPGLQFKLDENMYHGDLRYKPEHFFDSEVFIGYHTDSSAYNPWLYDRHQKAGLTDFLQWKNLSYYFIGTSFSPIKKLDFKIVFYDFSSTSNGTLELGSFAALIHKSKNLAVKQETLGKELDIQILSQINDELEVTLLTTFFLTQAEALFNNQKNFYNNIQLSALYKF